MVEPGRRSTALPDIFHPSRICGSRRTSWSHPVDILIVPSWYPAADQPISGVFFRDQVHALRRAGYRAGVMVPQLRPRRQRGSAAAVDAGMKFEWDAGVPTYSWHGWHRLDRPAFAHALSWVLAGERLYREFVRNHGAPRLIHAHSALYAGVLAVGIKKRKGIPVVVTEHRSAFEAGALKYWQRRAAARVFRGADARVVVGPALGKLLQRQFPKAFVAWDVVPNVLGRQSSDCKPTKRRQQRRGAFVFLNVGFLTPVKAQGDLLQAFATEFAGIPSVRLRIVGDGPLRGQLQELSEDLGVARQVTFLGELTREEVRAEMITADVLVLSSRHETFGVVLIEALACGTPVIATACGGPESIVNESNGLLVPVGDFVKLGNAMRKIRMESAAYDPEAIRRDCLTRFGEDAVVQQLAAVYQRVMGTSSRSVAWS